MKSVNEVKVAPVTEHVVLHLVPRGMFKSRFYRRPAKVYGIVIDPDQDHVVLIGYHPWLRSQLETRPQRIDLEWLLDTFPGFTVMHWKMIRAASEGRIYELFNGERGKEFRRLAWYSHEPQAG